MTMTTYPSTAASAEAAAEVAVATAAEEMSLYDAIGGRPSLVAAVDIFYGRVLADPELGPLFPRGVVERHRAYVVTFLGEALGGPGRYRGPELSAAHRGFGISDAHFDRAAGHLDATLDELGVPRDLTDRIIAIVATLRPVVVTA
jgi:hemoglobin